MAAQHSRSVPQNRLLPDLLALPAKCLKPFLKPVLSVIRTPTKMPTPNFFCPSVANCSLLIVSRTTTVDGLRFANRRNSVQKSDEKVRVAKLPPIFIVASISRLQLIVERSVSRLQALREIKARIRTKAPSTGIFVDLTLPFEICYVGLIILI